MTQHTVAQDIPTDSIEVDVVCVGAGVASLSTALRLLKRTSEAGIAKPSVMIIEKGAFIGAHSMSGAVLDPGTLDALLTADERAAMPIASKVVKETFCRLTRKHTLPLPWIPPMMQAHGFPIVSLTNLTQYLGSLCEKAGAEIYTGLSAAGLLDDKGRIVGVQIGHKGIDKTGAHKSNFEAGPRVMAKTVVLGEGGCGLLTEHLVAHKNLAEKSNAQTYAIGIKEVIETPPQPQHAGHIVHTFGYPLDYATYGGGFVYVMDATHVALGLVTALDYRDTFLNPHDLFRTFKAHPRIRRYIEGGTVVGYGAKVLPEGGFFSTPEPATDGALIVGDSAGLLDSLRLKGIHIAMQSGIAAGDTLAECWRTGDFSSTALSAYTTRLHATSGWKQMKRVRNVRAWFRFGQLPGMMAAGMAVTTFGALPPGRCKTEPDAEATKPLRGITPEKVKAGMSSRPASGGNDKLELDRLTDVFYSGVKHEEDQPCHLRIKDPGRCISECLEKFGAPCTRFCPAQVYTLAEEGDSIHIEFSNCLHCKTCQIKDPLGNIEWTPPEGGGGPKYGIM